jgi:60S ribosome subunit biogenesis protein NIP7
MIAWVGRTRVRLDTRYSVCAVACTCCGKMRALTDEETRIVFEKLSKFVGENLRYLVERPDGSYCFRLHRGRVYYVKEALMKWATNVGRKNLISMGVCVGKFTKTKKFHMQITALDVIQSYAKFKMWIKPNAEQAFLYGNHVSKSGLGRVTENMVQYQGVLLYSMSDIPLVRL